MNIGGEHTVVDWKSFYREILSDHFLRQSNPIGGLILHEIDETLSASQKHNVGRVVGQVWAFGGYDIDTHQGFAVVVENRSRATLLNVIRKGILPGNTIVSNLWARTILWKMKDTYF